MKPIVRNLAVVALLAIPSLAAAQNAPVLAVISHPVEDYAKWRAAYDNFASEQKTGGVIMEEVYQDPSDPNNVLVLHGFETVEAAGDFLNSDGLKNAMQGAGVSAPPSVTVVSRSD